MMVQLMLLLGSAQHQTCKPELQSVEVFYEINKDATSAFQMHTVTQSSRRFNSDQNRGAVLDCHGF
jgi:hypothetical protein